MKSETKRTAAGFTVVVFLFALVTIVYIQTRPVSYIKNSIDLPVKTMFWGVSENHWTVPNYSELDDGYLLIQGNDSTSGTMPFLEIRYDITMSEAKNLSIIGVQLKVFDWNTYIWSTGLLSFWCGESARNLCNRSYIKEIPMVANDLSLNWTPAQFSSWADEFPDKYLWIVVSVASITEDANIEILWNIS